MNHKSHNIIGVGTLLSPSASGCAGYSREERGMQGPEHELLGPRINQLTGRESALYNPAYYFASIGFMKPIGTLAWYLLSGLQPRGPAPRACCLVDPADHPERS
jgi:hypothetical protein